MQEVKAFVIKNRATVICPACNRARPINAEPFREKKHAVKARCECGEVFMLQLDFRGHYRKKTRLPGTFSLTMPEKHGGGVIRIRNISRSGIGFTVTGRHGLVPGDAITVDFHLDDKKKTPLKIAAVVQTVNGADIGCCFRDDTPIVSERALGFYLQP